MTEGEELTRRKSARAIEPFVSIAWFCQDYIRLNHSSHQNRPQIDENAIRDVDDRKKEYVHLTRAGMQSWDGH